MRLALENIDVRSNSGPNHFGKKLYKYLNKRNNISWEGPHDISLCFIESNRDVFDIPLVQRLDGIYFNTRQNHIMQNINIKRTYDNASGVVFQSFFNKELVFKYFGKHKNNCVIHNGADLELIDSLQPLQNMQIDRFENVWSCASSWRPHKRLEDNINYFLQHSGEKDCLVVAGETNIKNVVKHDRIFFAGNLDIHNLISLYKRSNFFIHLAWLDHCPNVVVDAAASGCQIICSSSGGTREVAGKTATIIEEEQWDMSPVDLYSPPAMDFSKKVKNNWDMSYNMKDVAEKYVYFLNRTLNMEIWM